MPLYNYTTNMDNKTEFIHMRIHPDLKKKVDKAAKKRFMKTSEWIQQAMLKALEAEK